MCNNYSAQKATTFMEFNCFTNSEMNIDFIVGTVKIVIVSYIRDNKMYVILRSLILSFVEYLVHINLILYLHNRISFTRENKYKT